MFLCSYNTVGNWMNPLWNAVDKFTELEFSIKCYVWFDLYKNNNRTWTTTKIIRLTLKQNKNGYLQKRFVEYWGNSAFILIKINGKQEIRGKKQCLLFTNMRI